jgi:hypothetical protein
MTETDQREDPDGDADPSLDDEEVTTTDGTRRRWWATNDVLSGLLLGSLTVLLGAGAHGVITLSAIPASWAATYLAVCGAAAAWSFGAEAIKAWRDSSN